MIKTNRRMFFLQAIVAGSALTTVRAIAQAPAKLSESDPQAVALGYKDDTKTVDTKRFPKHEESQLCSNCTLYQGKPKDEWAACAIFAGKQVAGGGWCSSWIKKAA